MKQLSIISQLLHKVGIDTPEYKSYSGHWRVKVRRTQEALNALHNYENRCVQRDCEGNIVWDFRGEYRMYINQGFTPFEAYHEVMVEFMWK